MSSNDEVDGWIAQLMQCKPLSETEVKKLCDKVGFSDREGREVGEELSSGLLLPLLSSDGACSVLCSMREEGPCPACHRDTGV